MEIKVENTKELRGLRQSMSKGIIHSAQYSPAIYPQFSLENEDCGIFLGCELELEANDDVSSRIIRNCVFPKYLRKMSGILKKDGSLNSYGIELLLLPHTFPALLTASAEAKLPQCFEYLEKLSTSYDNSRCGLHIHVDRSGLMEYGRKINSRVANYYDLQRAIARIFVAFRSNLRKISRREDEQMRFCELLSYVSDYNNHAKYLACNFQHGKTIEIRVWRGTLNFKSVLKYYVLSQALCMFAIKCLDYSIPDAFYEAIGENNASCAEGAELWSSFIKFYKDLVLKMHEEAQIVCNLDNYLLLGLRK